MSLKGKRNSMYQYLSGKLTEKNPTSAVIDVNGVGYLVQIPVSTFGQLPVLGDTVKLLTHFVVREDAQALYGFWSEEERDLFRMLISISGIGPKMAMTILSGSSLPELKQAIVNGSIDFLIKIPGIGRKTAERLVVELKEKIVIDERMAPSAGHGKTAPEHYLMEDAVSALIELGYKKPNAKEAVQRALKDSADKKMGVPDLIRFSLKYI